MTRLSLLESRARRLLRVCRALMREAWGFAAEMRRAL